MCSHACVQWTKDVESPTPPEYSRRTRDARSVTESIRAFAYDRALWRPPGFERHAVLEEVTLGGKKAADALEALIAVVFEAAGDVVAEAWLAYLGILPKLPIVRTLRHNPHLGPASCSSATRNAARIALPRFNRLVCSLLPRTHPHACAVWHDHEARCVGWGPRAAMALVCRGASWTMRMLELSGVYRTVHGLTACQSRSSKLVDT